MDRIERVQFVHNVADSIIDDFSISLRRVAALFKTPGEAVVQYIQPEIESALGVVVGKVESKPSYMGEKRELFTLLLEHGNSVSSWQEVFAALSTIGSKRMSAQIVKPGDFIRIPVNVKSDEIMGCEFNGIDISSTCLVVTAVYPEKVIFNFEDVITYAPFNSENTNKGGLAASALGKYLNSTFLHSVFGEVQQYLIPNKDGLKISLPTRYEVFGSGPENVNWGNVERHEYFEKCTHRIKVGADDKDDTKWWWNADPYPSHSAHFCLVSHHGDATNSNASDADGGVSPALCI